MTQNVPATEQRIEEIRKLQGDDPICQQIAKYCRTSWPLKHNLSPELKQYLPVSNQISVAEYFIMRGNRIIIPTQLRPRILQRLHYGHQGITKCRERAQQSVWWPGLLGQIKQMVQNCSKCCKNQSQPSQPLQPIYSIAQTPLAVSWNRFVRVESC